jgi:hypothetical protein
MERLEITAQKLNAMQQNKVVPLYYLTIMHHLLSQKKRAILTGWYLYRKHSQL